MAKFSFNTNRQLIQLLSEQNVKEIHEKALVMLENTGVLFYTDEALQILSDHGAIVDMKTKIAKLPRKMVNDAIEKAPESFDLYDNDGNSIKIGGDEVHFDPGSAGVAILESDGKTVHTSTGTDFEKIVRLTDVLENIDLASSSVVPHDVPEMISDSYRVYILLKNTKKPFISGAFSERGVKDIHSLLSVVAGGAENLAKKPRAILDICSLSPLKWTETSCHNILDCARLNIPMETLSVPLIGATAPATIYGCILMHTVESLSGLVLAQLVNPGARVVYGGAPSCFDMRHSTTSLNALEGNLISSAYAQMAKYFGLPCHTYSGLSDAKVVDAQAGLESGVTGIIAQLSGINVVSGVGLMDLCNTFSLEKLVIDNELCGFAKRLGKGIVCNEETLAFDLMKEIGSQGDYLTSEHTFEWYREETYWPSPAISRRARPDWEAHGSKTAFEQATEIVEQKLNQFVGPQLSDEVSKELDGAWASIQASLN